MGNNMENRVEKFLKHIFFYGVLVIVSSTTFSIFKTHWDDKTVYLSSSTCKFLKTIVPEFEKWLCRLKQTSNPGIDTLAYSRIEMLHLLRCFRNSDKAFGKDIDILGKHLLKAQKNLALEIKTIDFGHTNKHLHKLIKEIGTDISIAVRQVYVGTAKSDLKVIDNYLRHPSQEYTLQVYDLILDILKHFDGVAITEYDFVVLTSCALFVLFSIE